MIPVSLAMIFWGAVIVALGVALMLVILFKLALIASEMDMPEPLFPLFVLNFPAILFTVIIACAIDLGQEISKLALRKVTNWSLSSWTTTNTSSAGR